MSKKLSPCILSAVLLLHLHEITTLPRFLKKCNANGICVDVGLADLNKPVPVPVPVSEPKLRVEKEEESLEASVEIRLYGTRFKAFRTPLSNWFQATVECIYDGGILANMKNRSYHDGLAEFAHETFKELPIGDKKLNAPSWIGASTVVNVKTDKKHHWTSTVKGIEPGDFIGEPVNKGESCVAIQADGSNVKDRQLWLVTSSCMDEFPFICMYRD